MVAANERRPYYRTVVLLSVAESHSPLILCIAVTYLDPECCKLFKKKSKCDQDLLHSCIIRGTEMLNKATQLLTFLVDKSQIAVLGFLRTKKFRLTSIVRMQTLLWLFMGLSILHSLCRHELSTYFIKLSISNQGFSLYISIYNYEVK